MKSFICFVMLVVAAHSFQGTEKQEELVVVNCTVDILDVMHCDK